MQRYTDTQIHIHRCSIKARCEVRCGERHSVVKIHRYTDAQIHRCTDTQMHRCTDTQIHRYTNFSGMPILRSPEDKDAPLSPPPPPPPPPAPALAPPHSVLTAAAGSVNAP
jgi:hypothetical protein